MSESPVIPIHSGTVSKNPPRRPRYNFPEFPTLPDFYVPPDDADPDTDSDCSSIDDCIIREPGKPIDEKTMMRLCHPHKRIPAAQFQPPKKVLEGSNQHNRASTNKSARRNRSKEPSFLANTKRSENVVPASELSMLPYLFDASPLPAHLEEQLQRVGLHRVPQAQAPQIPSSSLDSFPQQDPVPAAHHTSQFLQEKPIPTFEQTLKEFEARSQQARAKAQELMQEEPNHVRRSHD